MKYSAVLLKHLFTKPTECFCLETIPKTEKDWFTFIDLIHTNRLPLSNYHFIQCSRCRNFIPKGIFQIIKNYYFNSRIRTIRRKSIISKIKRESQKGKIKIFFLKESLFLSNSESPKFDIDVFSSLKSKKKLFHIFNSFGYKYIKSAKEINCYKPQFKFAPPSKYKYLPQIEYRYKLHTIPTYPVFIMDKKKLDKMTEDFAEVITNNFSLPKEHTFILLCLIFFFEDNYKGFNNIYRIKQFSVTNSKILNWKRIDALAAKYEINTIVSFVIGLSMKIFSSPTKSNLSFWLRLALRGFDVCFVCRIQKNPQSNYTQWKDGYLCFLSRILLSDIHPVHKLILFIHPKRAFYFFYYFLIAPKFSI